MMSGHATIDTAVEATRIGALNFLEKPIALQKLLKTVSKALERAPIKKLDGEASIAEPNVLELPKSGSPDEYISGIAKSYFGLPLRESRDLFEKAYFEYQMVVAGGSMTRISEFTGLERTHLYRKLKALGIDVTKNKSEWSYIIPTLGLVAQSVEQRTENPCVGGSIPPRATTEQRATARKCVTKFYDTFFTQFSNGYKLQKTL